MIGESELIKISSSFNGEILKDGQPGYEEARKVWNGMIDRRPALIFRCASTEDVVQGVTFARRNKFAISVKAGGHGIGGFAVNDGGVVIDLSLMRKVTINNNGIKTAIVEGGSLLSDLDTASGEHGLAVPAGVISHTGVAGLTLGGGFGWISRKHGFTIDNLLSAEVVTADGDILKASESENADLFWAIRGGGGNFGVVTSLEFVCSEIGKEVFAGIFVRPVSEAKKYLQFYRDYVKTLPDEMTIWTVVRHAPPLPFLPEAIHGQLVVVSPFVYLGKKDDGEELLRPLTEHVNPAGGMMGMQPWAAWQSGLDALNVHYLRNYWKSHYLKELSDGCIDEIISLAKNFPTPLCEIFIPHLEGKPGRVSEDATAFSFRKIPFALNLHGRWEKKEDDKKCMAFAQEFYERTKPFAEGVYVNFLSNEGSNRVMDAYSPNTWKRLVEIKNKFDPENFFRSNQNIKPSLNMELDES